MNQMTTGASNDFKRATEMARRMVTEWGMSDLGPMVYGENEGEVFLGRSITTQKNVSEATMQKVDQEIKRIIDEQYALARKLIEENRDLLMDLDVLDGGLVRAYSEFIVKFGQDAVAYYSGWPTKLHGSTPACPPA